MAVEVVGMSVYSSCTLFDLVHGVFAGHFHRGIDQITNDGLYISAYITHLGEFGSLDFDKGRAGQLCQTPDDLGLADAGGADHEDVHWGLFLRAILRAHSSVASGCAGRWPRRVWRHPDRSCVYPVPEQFHGGSLKRCVQTWFQVSESSSSMVRV